MSAGLTEEYLLSIKPLINDTIENFLANKAFYSLAEKIQETAESVVYSYPASERAMQTRRGEIGSLNALEKTVQGHTLTIKNTTTLQHAPGVLETEIVQSGVPEYRQPYPRPFMEKALENYVDSGEADSELAQALEEAGFHVVRR